MARIIRNIQLGRGVEDKEIIKRKRRDNVGPRSLLPRLRDNAVNTKTYDRKWQMRSRIGINREREREISDSFRCECSPHLGMGACNRGTFFDNLVDRARPA